MTQVQLFKIELFQLDPNTSRQFGMSNSIKKANSSCSKSYIRQPCHMVKVMRENLSRKKNAVCSLALDNDVCLKKLSFDYILKETQKALELIQSNIQINFSKQYKALKTSACISFKSNQPKKRRRGKQNPRIPHTTQNIVCD